MKEKLEFTSPQERNEMVEARKISTVFTDANVLERVAEQLMSQGLVSGYSIEPIRAGYLYNGKEIKEDQYVLNVLSEIKDDNIGSEIVDVMASVLGKHWEVPRIVEEKVEINKSLLGFIERAETEHSKFVKERRRKWGFAAASFISLASLLGVVVERYGDNKEREGFIAAQRGSLDELEELEQEIMTVVNGIEGKIYDDKTFEEVPTDMAFNPGFEETQEVVDLIPKAKATLRRAVESQE